MSIRLRLTLLYSAILAVTLIVFGAALYSVQAQDTLTSLKRDLVISSGKLSEATRRISPDAPARDANPPPPKPFDQFSGEQAFRALPEREIARILDANGNLIASPFGRTEDALPLSTAGLAAVQAQQEWWESAEIDGENMLIYSRPIVQDGRIVYIIQVARTLTERDRTLESLATTLTTAGLLTIVLAFGAGWALSSFTLRPIHRLTQTAQAIGDERDFSRRVAYHGPPDEVGRLASTFNQMLAGLQEAYEQVEKALQMQRSFVADVSHELRTPLTTLRGNLGLLRRHPPAPPAEQADILADMVEESDRLIRLVNDLLELARADARRTLRKEPLALPPLCALAVRQASQMYAQRTIGLEIAPDLSVLADRDACKQVLLILLDNALKHSAGAVEVRARRDGAEVQIWVQDHGQGIAPDQLARVFDRFYRGEDTAAIPGFGLGLPIAKALTEGMGGTIALTSVVGQGSVVTLRWPAA